MKNQNSKAAAQKLASTISSSQGGTFGDGGGGGGHGDSCHDADRGGISADGADRYGTRPDYAKYEECMKADGKGAY